MRPREYISTVDPPSDGPRCISSDLISLSRSSTSTPSTNHQSSAIQQLPSPPQSHRLRLHPPRAIPLPPAIPRARELASSRSHPSPRLGTGAPSFRRGAGAARIIPSGEKLRLPRNRFHFPLCMYGVGWDWGWLAWWISADCLRVCEGREW